jgi:hypothetical protein
MGNVTANPTKFDLLYEDPSCLTYIHKNDPNVFLQTNDDHRAFLDIAVRTIEDKEAFWFLLKFVLKKSPEACLIRNKSGQLPIHTALNEVKPSLIINLFQKASPLSVEERCPLSGLYPFQLAAMSRRKDNLLDAVYSLLRPCPHLVADGIPPDDEKLSSQESIEIAREELELAKEELEMDRAQLRHGRRKRELSDRKNKSSKKPKRRSV